MTFIKKIMIKWHGLFKKNGMKLKQDDKNITDSKLKMAINPRRNNKGRYAKIKIFIKEIRDSDTCF